MCQLLFMKLKKFAALGHLYNHRHCLYSIVMRANRSVTKSCRFQEFVLFALFHCKACHMFKRLDSFQSDWLKKTAYLLVALLVQALLDYGELLLPSFDFQTCERGFDNPMHVLVHLFLRLRCRVLERAIRSCVAYIHLVRLVLI